MSFAAMSKRLFHRGGAPKAVGTGKSPELLEGPRQRVRPVRATLGRTLIDGDCPRNTRRDANWAKRRGNDARPERCTLRRTPIDCDCPRNRRRDGNWTKRGGYGARQELRPAGRAGSSRHGAKWLGRWHLAGDVVIGARNFRRDLGNPGRGRRVSFSRLLQQTIRRLGALLPLLPLVPRMTFVTLVSFVTAEVRRLFHAIEILFQ